MLKSDVAFNFMLRMVSDGQDIIWDTLNNTPFSALKDG